MKNGRVRVVVTGMGTVNPLGKNLEEYWDGLVEGRSSARLIEGTYPTDKLSTKFACASMAARYAWTQSKKFLNPS